MNQQGTIVTTTLELTDDEIQRLWDTTPKPRWAHDFARAIEQAVLDKLRQGGEPVPKCVRCGRFGHTGPGCDGHSSHPGPLYAAPQASADARNAALEEAAGWLENRRQEFDLEHGYMEPDTGAWSFGTGAHAESKAEYSAELDEIAEGIRGLKSTPAQRPAKEKNNAK